MRVPQLFLLSPYSLCDCSELMQPIHFSNHRSTALGSALLAGAAIKLFGWDLTRPETLNDVNTKGSRDFVPTLEEKVRQTKWEGWQRAVERSRGWEEGVDE